MSGSKDYVEKIKNMSTYDFSDNELCNFREAINVLYKVLKHVFDSPRRIPRVYNTPVAYELSREKLYQSPDDFYKFTSDNVVICIRFRARFNCYSVGVLGTKVDSDFLHKMNIKTDYLEINKDVFSQGFTYYGSFTRGKFHECVALYFSFVKWFIQNRLDEVFLLF